MAETLPFRGRLAPCGRTYMGTIISSTVSKRAVCSEMQLCPHCKEIQKLRQEAVIIRQQLARSGPQQLRLPGILDQGEVLEAKPVVTVSINGETTPIEGDWSYTQSGGDSQNDD